MVTAHLEWEIDLFWACFGFLQAEDVRLVVGNKLGKVFLITARMPLTFQEMSFMAVRGLAWRPGELSAGEDVQVEVGDLFASV